MARALARLGIQVTSNPKKANFAQGAEDGSLTLNYTPSGEEMWDNAALNEELWHLVNLLTLKAEWIEQGQPGDFAQFQDARSAEIFNELAERIRSLEGDERAQTEQALIDSFNLYFSKFSKGAVDANSLEDIEAAFGQEGYFGADINPFSVVSEFARQLARLRETGSITETTFAKLARQVMAYLNRALQTLRGVGSRSTAKEAFSMGPLSRRWSSTWSARCARSMTGVSWLSTRNWYTKRGLPGAVSPRHFWAVSSSIMP